MKKKQEVKKSEPVHEPPTPDLEIADELKSLPIDTQDIADWYHDESEDEVDMTKIERKPKRNWWPWLFGIVGVVLVLAAIGFSYSLYRAHRPAAAGTAHLSLSVPEKTAAGDAITLEVTYENQDVVAMHTAQLELVYPEGFVFQSSDPAPTTGNTMWEFNNIATGRGGKVYITGQLVGEVNTQKTFSAFFTYRPENLNYDFQETAQSIVTISSSTIAVTIDAPQRARSGQEIELKAEFKNTSKSPLKSVKVIGQMPSGFTLTSSDPSIEDNDLSWLFDELQPDETKTITLKGTLQGDSSQQLALTLRAGFVEIDGRFNVQVEKQALVLLINPSIDLKLEAPAVAAGGDELTYTTTVKNTSDVTLKQIKIRIILTGDFFQDEQLDLPSIDELAPNASTTLTAKTTLKDLTKARGLNLHAVATVKSLHVDDSQTTLNVTAETDTTIQGQLNFTTQARYFADNLQKIGDGPVPPKVNEKTTYVIWWDISSGPSDLKEVTVSATLPADVVYESGDPDLVYDRKKGIVSYSASVLKTGVSKHLTFSVSVTPTQDNFNGLMVLSQAATAQAVDTSANETLTAEADRLTTNLEGDPAAEGKGVVE